MDSALLKERAEFMKRAKAQPTIEKRPANKPSNEPLKKKQKTAIKPNRPEPSSSIDYKSVAPTSSHKFAILHKVIEYLKKRHHRGDNFPLSIDDLLDEAKMLDISLKNKQWLANEALLNNPKIDVCDTNTFKFKPQLPISSRKELLQFLKKKERHGQGGVLEEHVQEALPDADKHIERLLTYNRIYIITRYDKKRVLYFRDVDLKYSVDEEFVKLWRSVAVDGLDDKTIDEYLVKNGIASMQDIGVKRVAHPKRKKGGGKRKGQNFKKLNEHVTLEDYTEKN